jgi:alkylation response protein AidB-like acyl-CoA dehydrogenase
VTASAAEVVATAERLADDVLFPASLATDGSDIVPAELLDQLAAAGLYGLFGNPAVGGLGADRVTGWAVMEALAGGCLTTTFVWLQHLNTAAIASYARGPLRDEWGADLCAGRRRAGIAFAHLRRPGPPAVRATPAGDGWIVDGVAPWVTGWGRIDVVHVAALHGDDIVWLLIDAQPSATVQVTPLALAAINASATVELRLRAHPVASSRVTAVEPHRDWMARDVLGLRENGSLALGVARRALTLLGPSPLDHGLDVVRARLDAAGPDEMPEARAQASVFSLRAAAALVTAGGGRAIVRDHQAQRLAREALFLLVQGQTAAIKVAEQGILLEARESSVTDR